MANISQLNSSDYTPASGAASGVNINNLSPSDYSTDTQTPDTGQSTGFLQSMAQTLAKPFLQGARLPAGLIAEGIGKLTGNQDLASKGAAAASNEPYDFGYLGSVPAAGYDANGNPLNLKNATAQAVGAGLQIAPWFLGAGEAAPAVEGAATAAKQAVGAGSRILQGIGTGGAIGASQGAGNELQAEAEVGGPLSGKNVAEAGGIGLGTGAVTGGILSSLGELGSYILDGITGKTPGARIQAQTDSLKGLTNAVLDSKTNPVSTITDIVKSSKEPLLTVQDGKVKADLLLDAIGGMKRDVNRAVDLLVPNMPGTVNLGDFQTNIENAIKNNETIAGQGQVTQNLATLENRVADWVKSYGPKAQEGEPEITAKDVNVPYKVINTIRKSMNVRYNEDTVDLERTIGDVARDYLYDSDTGSPELQKMMKQWGALDDAENFTRKLNTSAVKGGRLGKYLADLAGIGVGSAMGSTLGPVGEGLGAIAGGGVTDKVMNMLQEGYFKPSVFNAPATSLSRFVGSVPVQASAGAGKQLLIRGLTNALANPSGSQQ